MFWYLKPKSIAVAGMAALASLASSTTWAQYQLLDVSEASETSPLRDLPEEGTYYWSVSTQDDETTLSGAVPYASVAEVLDARAGTSSQLAVSEGAPLGFMRDALTAISAIDLLAEGEAGYDETGWTISGALKDDIDPTRLEEILGTVTASGTPWTARIANLEAIGPEAPESASGEPDVSAAPTGDDAAGPELAENDPLPAQLRQTVETLNTEPGAAAENDGTATADAIALCREQLDELFAERSVLFGSGSARITPDSQSLLTDIAAVLQSCPDVPVYVEGHTDSDGGAQANLVLSLSRAEAVVDILVELGIPPQRLYAVGYGASLPIATNDTAAGKAQNRRIVFNFEDIAERTAGDSL